MSFTELSWGDICVSNEKKWLATWAMQDTKRRSAEAVATAGDSCPSSAGPATSTARTSHSESSNAQHLRREAARRERFLVSQGIRPVTSISLSSAAALSLEAKRIKLPREVAANLRKSQSEQRL
mmetsp:Transcript_43052/g.119063  ORF Transcript_43052/g.119063 Transcript_43052/m.119063 type:complete len:124 (-) Transcript_43052:112-483(-)